MEGCDNLKKITIPTFRKLYNIDLWTVRAIKMAMLREGINIEKELVIRLIKQVLKHKRCPSAKDYSVDKKRNKIEVLCSKLGNWVDAREVCLKNCVLTEFKTGKRYGDLREL